MQGGTWRPSVARVGRTLFPGSAVVWKAALAAVVVFAVLGFRLLNAETASLTGTNSVGIGTVIADVNPGQKLCVRDLLIPKETGRVGLWMFGQQIRAGARYDAWVQLESGRRLTLESPRVRAETGFDFFSLAAPLKQDAVRASLCVVPTSVKMGVGGASVQRLPGAPVSLLAGSPLVGKDVAVRYDLPATASRSFASVLVSSLSRSTTFEPWFGRILTWISLPALLLLIYLVTRVAATADRRTTRALVVGACGVAFVHAAAWSVLLAPLHGADESEHFGYAQHLAAAGERPDEAAGSQRPPYSSAEERLMGALHHNSTTLNPSSRPRWDAYWEREFRRSLGGVSGADGGGYTESGTGHGPLYYSLVSLPLRILDEPAQQPAALLAMRLLNALFASLIAGIAVLVALLLAPGRKDVAWFAGLLAGLQPVFGSVAGAVNNDTGVNVLAAATVLLLVLSYVRGPSLRRGIATGGLLVLLPLAKITGFEIVPIAALLPVLLAVRYGFRASAKWTGGLVATCVASFAVWSLIVSPLLGAGRGDLVYRHPAPPAPAAAAPSAVAAAPAGPTPVDKLEYVIQTFVPTPTIGPDHWALTGSRLQRWPAFRIYIDRGYGLFGWKSTNLSMGMLRGILIALTLGWALTIIAAVRRRRAWRSWGGPALILVATVGSVLLFVGWAYATNEVRTDLGEQGRYVFPALVPLAVLFSCGAYAFRSAIWRHAYLGVGSVATSGLAALAWTTALRGWFS